ncbi:DUF1178 family protein [Uliginosibacterium gangwonense]|uniref:DUF1178 family protein n=1 Tax=Uliginosibacterium gangwonense TaxID=392736 RepID=UPI000378DD92|nr:DUF1178 family protein [Uliginosibacterium gangwonense]
MIVVDLICSAEHRFEGWFASQEAFEHQNAAGMVSCPKCGATHIRRLPSAPHLARAIAPTPAPTPPAVPPEAVAKLIEAIREHAANSEDVGSRFPEEARRIYYGDAEERAIRGQASPREALDLLEEGISVLPVPPKEDLH